VVNAAILDAQPNRTFVPAQTVSRGEFSMAMSRLTRVLGVTPAQSPSIPTPDLVPGHALYGDVQLLLQSGLLTLDNLGNFDIKAQVSGREAVNAMGRLHALSSKEAVELR
jgi:hypothetical protein